VAKARLGLPYSRRFISRIETHEHVWVCWRCEGIEDIFRVCDLSVGGLFLSTPIPWPMGAKAKIEFLVPEGQIRAEAVIQYVIPYGGLGLKFTAIIDQDCPNLVALLNRISMPSRPFPVIETECASFGLQEGSARYEPRAEWAPVTSRRKTCTW
jgi:PilZ domain